MPTLAINAQAALLPNQQRQRMQGKKAAMLEYRDATTYLLLLCLLNMLDCLDHMFSLQHYTYIALVTYHNNA